MSRAVVPSPFGAEPALRLFVATINAAGGLILNDEGVLAPLGDASWTDLAVAYLDACEALGVAPMCEERDTASCRADGCDGLPERDGLCWDCHLAAGARA